MSPRKRVISFFICLVALYVLLVAAWPLWRTAYLTAYCAAGNLLFSRFGTGASVQFKLLAPPEAHADAVAQIVNYSVPPNSEWVGATITRNLKLNVHDYAYLPTVMVMSLILATPLAWRRRMRALALGGLLLAAFLILWVGLSLLDTISDPALPIPTHGYILSREAKTVVRFLSDNVLDSVNACAFIAPIFIWIVAAFGPKDREWVFPMLFASPRQSGPL